MWQSRGVRRVAEQVRGVSHVAGCVVKQVRGASHHAAPPPLAPQPAPPSAALHAEFGVVVYATDGHMLIYQSADANLATQQWSDVSQAPWRLCRACPPKTLNPNPHTSTWRLCRA